MNFKITSSAKMWAVLAVVTGAKFEIVFQPAWVEGSGKDKVKHPAKFVYGDREHGTEGSKEIQNATLLRKYICDVLNTLKGTPESRIKRVVSMIKDFTNVTTWRTLNNSLRRSTDDGTIFPVGTYFYEGTSHPSKQAAKPAKKSAKKATVAPAAPAKKAAGKKPVVKATTPAKAKAPKATKPAAKATKPAATKAPKAKATPVAQSEPAVEQVVDPVIETVVTQPEAIVTPEATVAE